MKATDSGTVCAECLDVKHNPSRAAKVAIHTMTQVKHVLDRLANIETRVNSLEGEARADGETVKFKRGRR